MQIPKQLLEWMRLQEQITKEMIALYQGKEEAVQGKHLIDLSRGGLREETDFTVYEHMGDGKLELNPSQLKLYLLYLSPNQKDGKVIEGNKLRKELEKNKVPVLNACVLDYLISHPELIPEDWKKDENGNTRYIYFWGTVYRHQIDDLYVRYLYWNDGAWDWDYCWLGEYWDGQHPAAVLA